MKQIDKDSYYETNKNSMVIGSNLIIYNLFTQLLIQGQ